MYKKLDFKQFAALINDLERILEKGNFHHLLNLFQDSMREKCPEFMDKAIDEAKRT